MSKDIQTNLQEYIYFLKELIIGMINNYEIKNYEAMKKLDNLKTLLAKRGITPDEINKVLSTNVPFDMRFEALNNELINEIIPYDINDSSKICQQGNYKDQIIKFIQGNDQQFEQFGISLNKMPK